MKQDTFIYQSKVSTKICKDILKYYHDNQDKVLEGIVGMGIDKDVKESKDISIQPDFNDYPFNEYKNQLQKCIDKYRKKYPELDSLLQRWAITEAYNIQCYKPGGGFKKIHCERGCVHSSPRVLVFMTYLNTVKDAGTSWPKQKFTSDCVIGSTLIWPTDWTHSHVGIINKKKKKCVITGWYGFNGEGNCCQ
jgi:hypothetical protein|tara:strand:- start:3626 stop:4201 length:576 start_codon:yes stop_codon:yes gene_type:complete